MMTRRLLPFVFVVLLLVGCTGGRQGNSNSPSKAAAAKVKHLPASIPSDCSRAVESEIMAFLATVPDGGTAVFPPRGCFGQDATILVADRNDLVIEGNRSTFTKRSPSDLSRASNANWRVAGGRGVVLKNMLIKGSYNAPPRGTPGQGNHTDHGVSLWGPTDPKVLDVEVQNVDGECLTADSDIRKGTDYRLNPPSRNVVVERLRCAHAGRQGVAATAVDGFRLADSSIEDAQQTGIDIEIDAPGQLARNVEIVNNTISGVYFSAVAIPLGDSPEVGNIVIRGNTMLQAPDTCWAAVFVGDNRFRLSEIKVVDNTLLTIGDGVRMIQVDAGEVARNRIRKTNPENTSCHHPENTPPESVGVRLTESTVAASENTVTGFAP